MNSTRSSFLLGSAALLTVAGCGSSNGLISASTSPANSATIADPALSELMNQAGILAYEKSGGITFSSYASNDIIKATAAYARRHPLEICPDCPSPPVDYSISVFSGLGSAGPGAVTSSTGWRSSRW